MRILAIAGLVLVAAAGLASGATVYRSVGPDGQVIYSDKPPADSKTTKRLDFTDLPATPLHAQSCWWVKV